MYKVIHFFTDLKDNSHPYNVGDTFPRKGVEVSPQRYAELSSKYNLQGKPLIQYIENIPGEFKKSGEDEHIPTKTEINRMSTANLRIFAMKNGICDADKISGAELKKILIEKFNL